MKKPIQSNRTDLLSRSPRHRRQSRSKCLPSTQFTEPLPPTQSSSATPTTNRHYSTPSTVFLTTSRFAADNYSAETPDTESLFPDLDTIFQQLDAHTPWEMPNGFQLDLLDSIELPLAAHHTLSTQPESRFSPICDRFHVQPAKKMALHGTNEVEAVTTITTCE